MLAQGSAVDEIAKYRAALQDGNPAELWEARGEDLWKQKRGPKQVSLQQLRPWARRRASSRARTRSCRDISPTPTASWISRRAWSGAWSPCRATPRPTQEELPSATAAKKSDIEALVAYITSESRGVTMNVSLAHPKEAQMYRLGRKDVLLPRRPARLRDASTCHGEDGKRIRLQDLPNLTTLEGAQKAYTTWPAYRVSQGELRTFQWRLYDCFRQQRFPELDVRLGRDPLR